MNSLPEGLVEIDASLGEAGGQVLRTSVALSALLGKQLALKNIRARRPKPGLMPQHLASVNAVAAVCSAELKGNFLDSTGLSFFPKKAVPQTLHVNIGTAGSIPLLFSQLLPVSMLAELKVHASGGTNVPFSPPVEFLQHALLPALKSAGARFSISLSRHGFYPKGNGLASLSSKAALFPLRPIKITRLGSLEEIRVFSSCASLPKEVALNQAAGAKASLNGFGAEFVQEIDFREKADTIGSSITLLASFSSGAVLSGSALGEKGKPAELVGKEAAKSLASELDAGMPCDSHLADQLIPFMALARGKSGIWCTRLSQHCLTNISIVEKFLPVHFEVEGVLGEPAKISVAGIAFSPGKEACL